MRDPNEYYKTKLTVEVEIQTQFGPQSAVDIIRSLTNIPAVDSVVVTDIDSDYDVSDAFPENLNLKCINSIPIKLK